MRSNINPRKKRRAVFLLRSLLLSFPSFLPPSVTSEGGYGPPRVTLSGGGPVPSLPSPASRRPFGALLPSLTLMLLGGPITPKGASAPYIRRGREGAKRTNGMEGRTGALFLLELPRSTFRHARQGESQLGALYSNGGNGSLYIQNV